MDVYNRFVLPSKQRKVIWIHDDIYRALKKYSWAMNISIAEATHSLLSKALEDAKNNHTEEKESWPMSTIKQSYMTTAMEDYAIKQNYRTLATADSTVKQNYMTLATESTIKQTYRTKISRIRSYLKLVLNKVT